MLPISKRSILIASFGCLLLLWTLPAGAQTTYGRIVGHVTDSSGAAVPTAVITARSLDTNAAHTMRTTNTGDYDFPDLPIGSYEVSAEATGFKHYVQTALTLVVNLTLRVDIRLEVGNVKEAVTVTGEAPVIETDQSSVGTVMDNRTVAELPMDGRHIVEITQLAPGATAGQNDAVNRFRAYGADMTSDGGRPEQNNYLLDGMDNTSYILGTMLVLPSVDAIQELKVQSENYSAEFGQASGGVVNLAIKSGTNHFHGDAYDFLQNNKLDARNFFAPYNLPFRQNQFGATLGGPIIKDKLFFFFSYEGYRSDPTTPTYYVVPTAAMVAGNFSGTLNGSQLPTLYDPAHLDANGNRLSFLAETGVNAIPRADFSPIASKLLQYMPTPNSTAAAGNYLGNYTTPTNRAQFTIHADYLLSSKDQISGRYTWWNGELLQKYLNFLGSYWYYYPRNYVLGWTHSYSGNLVQEVRGGFSKYEENVTTPGQGTSTDYNGQLGLQEYPLSGLYTFPTIGISGVNPGFGTNQPSIRLENHIEGMYHLTMIHGKQTIKAGADIMRFQDTCGFNYTMGTYSFTGTFTSPIGQSYPNGFGDFLLGDVASQTLQYPLNWDFERLRNTRVQSYVQDDINVTPHLTLNLGLRWDWYGPWADKNHREQYFDLAAGEEVFPAALKLPYTLPFPNRFDPNYDAVQNARNRQVGPRGGFAWRPFGNDRTVIRSAYGIFWTNVAGYLTANQATQGAGINLSDTESSSSIAPTLTWGIFNASQSPGSLVPLTPKTFSTDPNTPNPYVQQWNLGIEHQLMRNTALKVAYVGNRATHLDGRYPANLSYPPAAGNNLLRLRYPAFRGITEQNSQYFSDYNSLQISLDRRVTQGVTLLSNYTWSKCIDDDSGWSSDNAYPQNIFNVLAEKGRCEQDARSRLNIAYVYQLPFHFEQRLLRQVAQGWETSGIAVISSGFPFSVSAQNLLNNGGGTERANYIGGAWALPASQRTANHWFNTAAFSQPAAYTFGNSGRTIVDGPGTTSFDLAVMKNFPIYKEQHRLQFRAEFFNAFNHPFLHFPDNNLPDTTFGVIQSTWGSPSDSRTIQFALKYIF